jgi:hypothetical protein
VAYGWERHFYKESLTGNMDRFIFTILILIFAINLLGQDVEKYPSKEEDEYYKKVKDDYYKSMSNQKFKPIDKSEIINYKSNYFEIKELKEFSPYDVSKDETPYSMEYSKIFWNAARSASGIPEPEYIGKVGKNNILKYDKKREIEAFIYTSVEFDDNLHEPGIWIGYSIDAGMNWNYYYTGIVQKEPLFLKWYSSIPFILENGSLQIEAALLRQLEPFTNPRISKPNFEIIKDGTCIKFDISQISKDTDKDGLSDIVENKFCTDFQNQDTDNDGIPDNLDLNPRYNVTKTKRTVIFENFINHWYNQGSIQNCVTDSTQTVMIVTDNADLLSVQLIKPRIIFYKEKEYEQLKNPYNTGLNSIFISQLFKVNNRKDTYKLSISDNLGGVEYLIYKSKNCWEYKDIGNWIF